MEKVKEILEIFKSLTEAKQASGSEAGYMDCISELLGAFSDEIKIDIMGNIHVSQNGIGSKMLFTANVDVPAYMVYKIDENGFLYALPLGNQIEAFLPKKQVKLPDGTKGVIEIKNEGNAEKLDFNEIDNEKLFIDIGAKNKEGALKHAQIGDCCVIEHPTLILANDRLASAYCTNLMGAAVVILIARILHGSNCNVEYIFAAQGRKDSRGLSAAAYSSDPVVAVVIDTHPASDSPAGGNGGCSIGKGPVVTLMDSNAIASAEVVCGLKEAADKENIEYQYGINPLDQGAAAAVQRAKGAVPVAVLGIPARYRGSVSEVVDVKDAAAAAIMAAAYCRSFSEVSK